MPELAVDDIRLSWDTTGITVHRPPRTGSGHKATFSVVFAQLSGVSFRRAGVVKPGWIEFVPYGTQPATRWWDAVDRNHCVSLVNTHNAAVEEVMPLWQNLIASANQAPAQERSITCMAAQSSSLELGTGHVTVQLESKGAPSAVVALSDVTAFDVDPAGRRVDLAWRRRNPDGSVTTEAAGFTKCQDPGFTEIVGAAQRRLPSHTLSNPVYRGLDLWVALHDNQITVTEGRGSKRRSRTIECDAVTSVDYSFRRHDYTVRLQLTDDRREKLTFSHPRDAAAFATAVGGVSDDIDRRKPAPAQPLAAQPEVDLTTVGPSDLSPRAYRLGRAGHTVTAVPFLSTSDTGINLTGAGPDGQRWLRAHRDASPTPPSPRRGACSVTTTDGRRLLEIGKRPAWRPWTARPIHCGPHRTPLTVQVRAATVWFHTSWRTAYSDNSTMITMSEPLRDAFLRRVLRVPARGFTNTSGGGGGSLADVVLSTLLLIATVAVGAAFLYPLSLLKRNFRFIIRDADGRRIGVAEHRTWSPRPSDATTVWLDVDALRRYDANELLAATYTPIVSIWA
ncbi:hypothetical protein [Williamsia sp. CHRR-6]|uniref:hypothetical protein n=1 Tax=Williamsia sp. CHRR-6 TaxID=2835871 RepID=UPI001BD9BAD7|nr:hypothetical protein [Williamsia sp. CHRR-6]MBT0566197.1 hypothetical protein [Williamsia sp. CHRR-6]